MTESETSVCVDCRLTIPTKQASGWMGWPRRDASGRIDCELGIDWRCPRCADALVARENQARCGKQKGRMSMGTNGKTEDKDRTGMVLRDLTEDEKNAKAESLAAACKDREKLEEKKRTHNRKWNEELIQLDDQISELAEEVNSGQAWVPAQNQFDYAKAASNGAEKPKKKRGKKGAEAEAEAQ